jgi:CheY-like chemotaxis protein
MKPKMKILVVEDNPNASETIRDILLGLGKCFVAESGEQALRLIKKTIFDVIILDVKLPGIDGIETLRRAREIRPNLAPVIILTGYPDTSTALAAGKLEVFNYLTKDPIDEEKLKQAVITASSSKIPLRPCYKHNTVGCLYPIPIEEGFVFVGMPFSLNDIYEYGIKPTVESFKLKSWRADEEKKTGDMGCKICASLQLCKFAVMEVSDRNPNVCIEVGLAYGYGKKIILLKKKDSPKPPSDLDGIEYLEYGSIDSLKSTLAAYIVPILET